MTGDQVLACTIERSSPTVRIVLKGDLDLATSVRVPVIAGEILDDDDVETVVVDLTAVAFIDSSGLRALLELQTQCRGASKAFALTLEPGPVPMLLKLAGVDGWFDYV